jgi:hypothetical protein
MPSKLDDFSQSFCKGKDRERYSFLPCLVLIFALTEAQASTPWHFLYFFPDPQGQGSLRPTLPTA